MALMVFMLKSILGKESQFSSRSVIHALSRQIYLFNQYTVSFICRSCIAKIKATKVGTPFLPENQHESRNGVGQRLGGTDFVAERAHRLKGLVLKTIAELGVNMEYIEAHLDMPTQRDLFQALKVCDA